MITDALKDDRKQQKRLLDYEPDRNYVGSGVFVYPKWMPYWRHLNWPACQHDYNYNKHDRSTWSNKSMIEDFALELILSEDENFKGDIIERHPASLRFILPMLYFYAFPFMAVSIFGRFIDKGRI